MEPGCVGDPWTTVPLCRTRLSRSRQKPSSAATCGFFETCRVADLQELVAEDVLIHGAGQNVRDLTMTGIKSCRVADGRIVEFWGETDLYGLLRQAGLVPDTIPTL